MRTFFVYDDYGCSAFCTRQLVEMLTRLYGSESTAATTTPTKVVRIDGKRIQQGELNNNNEDDVGHDDERMLCLGGGFDLGYLSSLGERGIDEIRRFVASGGNYVGICAGAYFAAEHVRFDSSGPLRVVGARHLRFFAGVACGPVNKRYKYGDASDEEAMAVGVRLATDTFDGHDDELFYTYMNGGCHFVPSTDDNDNDSDRNDFSILATYDFDKTSATRLDECFSAHAGGGGQIAMVECRVGKGRCLLSGVHYEIDAHGLAAESSRLDNVRQNLVPRLLLPVQEEKRRAQGHSNERLIRLLFAKVFNI